jgi:hypothetical protein
VAFGFSVHTASALLSGVVIIVSCLSRKKIHVLYNTTHTGILIIVKGNSLIMTSFTSIFYNVVIPRECTKWRWGVFSQNYLVSLSISQTSPLSLIVLSSTLYGFDTDSAV